MAGERKRININSVTEELIGLKEKVKTQMNEMRCIIELIFKDRKEDLVKNSQPDPSYNVNCSVCTNVFVTKSTLKKHRRTLTESTLWNLPRNI